MFWQAVGDACLPRPGLASLVYITPPQAITSFQQPPTSHATEMRCERLHWIASSPDREPVAREKSEEDEM